jgi:hypothetical protein
MSALYREAAARHPDPLIRTLVAPKHLSATTVANTPQDTMKKAPKKSAAKSTPTPNGKATDWIPFDERPIEAVDPAKLTVHAYVEHDPMFAPKDRRLLAKERGWDERGTCRPLLVTADNRVVSGRHSLRHALKRGWKTVPVRRIEDREVVEAADKDFFAHHHTSQAVRAYLAAPKIEPALQAARERRDAIRDSGGKLQLPPLPNIDDFATELDIDATYLKQARQLHALFGQTKAEHGVDGSKLRKEWEPKLLRDEDPITLADALRALPGRRPRPGRPARRPATARSTTSR